MVAGYLPFDEPSLSTLFRRIQTANYPWYLGDDLRSEAIISPRSTTHELSANDEAKERVKKASTFVAPVFFLIFGHA